jgi:hypothetical protein
VKATGEGHWRRDLVKAIGEGHRWRPSVKAIGEGSHKGLMFGFSICQVSESFFENLLRMDFE